MSEIAYIDERYDEDGFAMSGLVVPMATCRRRSPPSVPTGDF